MKTNEKKCGFILSLRLHVYNYFEPRNSVLKFLEHFQPKEMNDILYIRRERYVRTFPIRKIVPCRPKSREIHLLMAPHNVRRL